MTIAGHGYRCLPRQRLANASPCPWLAVHLLLYVALSLGTAITSFLWTGEATMRGVAAEVLVVIVWFAPVHLIVLLIATAELLLLRYLAIALNRVEFRMFAVIFFALPVPALSLLLTARYLSAFLTIAALHVLMGLLVVQPRPGWAHRDPDMAEHD